MRTTANTSVAVDSPAGRARRTCLRGRGMAWHQWGTWADNGFASCAVRLVLNATARAHVGSRSLLVQVRDACVGCSCQQRLWLCSVTCRSPRDIRSSPRARGPHQGKVPKGKEWNGAPGQLVSTEAQRLSRETLISYFSRRPFQFERKSKSNLLLSLFNDHI